MAISKFFSILFLVIQEYFLVFFVTIQDTLTVLSSRYFVQPAIICSKLTTEALEQGVEYVLS